MNDTNADITDADTPDDADTKDIIKSAHEAFTKAKDAESENRASGLDDVRFVKLNEQWPSDIKTKRQVAGRPCLTINRLSSVVRQVVNDARQNKPSIQVKAADSNADPKTAEVIGGLIRNIEHTSNADVAYDTAVDHAVTSGFGYIRVGMDYAFDDAFDMDLSIERIINPFSVYGDPHATSADGSDWNVAFILDRIPKAEFKRKYKGKPNVDFEGDEWGSLGHDWIDDDTVTIAEYWVREEVDREIVKLSDGRVFGLDQLQEDLDMIGALQTGAIQIADTRTSKTHKVTQHIMSGVDVLETNDWPGRYIPIVPVYGDEFTVEGKRYFRSLINQAKDANRMVNYWRTTSTELVALAPRVPFIGPQGAFDVDENWATANSENHPYLEYANDAPAAPQRQPLDMGVAAGSLQEALNASDDIKAITGIYDASLGARSNETSGRAIMARQREGDVSTFHFIDNLSRSIRHVGRILIDLIPAVYTGERIIRVLGEDGTEKTVPLNQPTPQLDKKGQPERDEMGQVVMAIHDLGAGKYDQAVDAGPSFTTRREEAAAQMTELVRAYPAIAPAIGDLMARNFDWPGADELAERLKGMVPGGEGMPPEVKQMVEEGQQLIAQLKAENEKLKNDRSIDQAKVQVDEFEAQTDRMKAVAEIERPQQFADY